MHLENIKTPRVDIQDINKRYNEWAAKQFPNSTPVSSLKGLIRECDELIEELNNVEIASLAHSKEEIDEITKRAKLEFADCLMYLIDSARRYGLDIKEFTRDKISFQYSTSEECLELIKCNSKILILRIERKVNSDFVNFLYQCTLQILFGSAELFGLSIDDLFLALDEKLQINLSRDWKINDDKSYSHVK